MKRWLWTGLALFLAACSLKAAEEEPFAAPINPPEAQIKSAAQIPTALPTQPQPPTAPPTAASNTPVPTMDEWQRHAADLSNLGAAPELHDGIWLNTTVPFKLSDVRGQVVLVDMWTFG